MDQTENPCTQEESPPRTCVAAAEIPAAPAPKREYKMDEDDRRQELEDDAWTVNVQPNSVGCRACSRKITLDNRHRYYATNWNRHSGRCRVIKRLTGVPIPKIQRKRQAKAAPKRGVAVRTGPADAITIDENGRSALSTDKDGPCSEASKQGTPVTNHAIISPNVQMDGQEDPPYDSDSGALLVTGKLVCSTTGGPVIALSQYPEEPHNWHRELEVELLESDDDDDEDMLPLPPLRAATWGSVYNVREPVETLEGSRRNGRENSSDPNRD
ncbi:hypothetical protein H0H92_014525, partial [Tricholoma furcatifolium]